jgi:ATP-binding cassette subfamily B protein
MADQIDSKISSRKLFQYITKEKRDVASIYVYAILNGLVMLSIPLGIQAIVGFVMGASMVTSLYILIGFVVLGTWLAGYFRIKVMQIIEKIQQKIFVENAIEFAEKLPRVNLSSTKKYYLPELVNRFFDTQNLQKGISKLLLEIPTALIQIIFGILLLSFYHPWFLVFGALVIIIVVLIFRFTMDSGIKSSNEESDKKYEVASWLEDIAGAVKTFKINSKTDIHLSGVDNRVLSYLDHRTSHFKVLLFQYKTIIGFKVVITLLVLAIGTYLMVNQELNIGAFIAAEIVVLSIMTAVEKLIISLESYYDAITSLTKLNKVTELTEEANGEIIPDLQPDGMEVEFRDIAFSYNSLKPILHNLSFTIPENTITVINGKLGSGKSLLLNMMAGFYQPTAGTMLFDKIPLKNIDKVALRDKIGLYLEDMTIIKGTLQENILMGRNDFSAEEILELSENMGIENLPSQFSNGLFTDLSETDTELSFSAKKKILLLRAMLGRKRLLLLEDPLDGMNKEFKAKMKSYLTKVKSNTTVVIVSENEELIQIADQLLVLSNGTLEAK